MYRSLLEPDVVTSVLTSDPLAPDAADIPALDAAVTRATDRRAVAVSVVNRHPDAAVACRLAIKGLPANAPIEWTVLVGDSPDAYNDVAHAARIVPQTRRVTPASGTITLPPHSVSVLTVGA